MSERRSAADGRRLDFSYRQTAHVNTHITPAGAGHKCHVTWPRLRAISQHLRVARHRRPERGEVMDLLKRELAPITSEAWQQIDEEARRVLKLHLAGRKLVDFSGPHGWQLGAVNTGRLKPVEP